MIKQQDLPKWHMLFSLLSLKCAKKLWVSSGLEFLVAENQDKIIEQARVTVRSYRKIEHDLSLDDSMRIKKYADCINEGLLIFKGDQLPKIKAWSKLILDYFNESLGYLWNQVFMKLAELGGRNYKLAELGLTKEADLHLKKMIKAKLSDKKELYELLEKTAANPEDDWDQFLIKNNNVDQHYFDWFFTCITNYKCHLIWEEIKDTFEENDIDKIKKWGEKQAKLMNMI